MTESSPNNNFVWKRFRGISVAAILIAFCGFLFHARSYLQSDSLTLCDVTLTTDEGLLSLQIPLTRLAASQNPTSKFLIYHRSSTGWNFGGMAAKCPLRTWMSLLNATGCEGAMCVGFGYWKGAWQSESRPGSFAVVFAPLWSVTVLIFGVYSAFHFRLLRFGIRALFVTTAVCAALSWLVTMRDST